MYCLVFEAQLLAAFLCEIIAMIRLNISVHTLLLKISGEWGSLAQRHLSGYPRSWVDEAVGLAVGSFWHHFS